TRRQGFVFPVPQPIESVDEFRIITTNGGAIYGRNLAGQVNVLTKRGGRVVDGMLYGFLTTDALNARSFFDQVSPGRSNLTRATDGAPASLDGTPVTQQNLSKSKVPLTRSIEGFTLGGPLPLLSDSVFFLSFERLTVRSSQLSHFAVPTLEERGLFGTGATGFTSKSGVEFFPASLPGNAVFSLYPFPNNPGGPYGPHTYTELLSADSDGSRFSLRMEHQFGENDPRGKRLPLPWNFGTNGDRL